MPIPGVLQKIVDEATNLNRLANAAHAHNEIATSPSKDRHQPGRFIGTFRTRDEAIRRGWYPRRRGILEHLESGKISLLDLAVHDFLCLTAYPATGVAITSAEKIRALSPRAISLRAIQRSLDHLERIGWIKRWRTPGKKGNYPILLARWFTRGLSLMNGKSVTEWKSVNAERTTDWKDVRFDPVTDPSFLRFLAVSDDGTDASPLKEFRYEEVIGVRARSSSSSVSLLTPQPPKTDDDDFRARAFTSKPQTQNQTQPESKHGPGDHLADLQEKAVRAIVQEGETEEVAWAAVLLIDARNASLGRNESTVPYSSTYYLAGYRTMLETGEIDDVRQQVERGRELQKQYTDQRTARSDVSQKGE